MDPIRPADVDPAEVIQAANDFGATVLFGSPALLDRVGRGGATTDARMPSLRRVISAGAPVSRTVQRQFLRLLPIGAEIFTPYGATEALPVTSIGSGELLDLTERGFCVGVAHRVTTARVDLFSVPCEEVFNAHPAVARSALVGVGPPGSQRPVVCIELELGRSPSAELTRELLGLGAADPQTASIAEVRYHPRFPVDIRHNSKIDRERLAAWVNGGAR